MSRSSLLTVLVTLLLLAIALPLLAQETADIALGGGLVARLRDKGTYTSVRDRASAVDKALCDVVSNKDTQHPQVSLKQKGALWAVYAWDVAVLTVYPAEAKANGLTERQLGAMWAANLKERLPKATPCSKLPPEQLGYKPAPKPATTTVTAKPTAAQPPVKTAAAKPVVVSTKPTKIVAGSVTIHGPNGTTIVTSPVSTMTGNETGAMLLIVDALRTSRDLNDADWAAQKETIAKGLYSDLSYYLTGKGVAPKLPTTATVTKPAAKPVVVTTKPAAKPVVATKPVVKPVVKPATTPVKKPVITATKPVAKPVVKPADASTAKVPQKNRIRAKFAASKTAFDKLQAADPAAAEPIAKLLADSRQAFAWGNFDESEKQVDEALAALGVTYTGQ